MNEALFTPPRATCDTSRYSTPDAMGSEAEVSQLVAAFVPALHPDRVLETGSYHGHTSKALGEALKKQGYGHLDTLEIDKDKAEIAERRCKDLPVTVHAGPSLAFEPTHKYKLFFFDSDVEDRADEMHYFHGFAEAGAKWLLHDMHHPHLQQALPKLIRARVIKKESITVIQTPRPLAIGDFT